MKKEVIKFGVYMVATLTGAAGAADILVESLNKLGIKRSTSKDVAVWGASMGVGLVTGYCAEAATDTLLTIGKAVVESL